MDNIFSFLLQKYEIVDVNVRKKARYSLYFIGILLFHALTILLLSLFVTVPQEEVIYTALSFGLYVLLILLIFKKRLRLTLYLFMAYILFKSIYFLSMGSFITLLTFLVFVLAFILIVYRGKLDLYISGGTIGIILLLSFTNILSLFQDGLLSEYELYGIMESILNVIVYGLFIYIIVTILEAEIERSRSLQDSQTIDFIMKAQQRRDSDKIKEIQKLDVKTSLLLISIDGFDKITESKGKEISDQLLKEVITLIRKRVRVDDYILRWNYDDFLVVLNHTPLSNAGIVAEKIRNVVSKTTFESMKGTVTVTIAAVMNRRTMQETINKLEEVLQTVKTNKKNHIELDFS